MDLLFLSSLKTLLMSRKLIKTPLRVNVLGFSYGRFWVTPEGIAKTVARDSWQRLASAIF